MPIELKVSIEHGTGTKFMQIPLMSLVVTKQDAEILFRPKTKMQILIPIFGLVLSLVSAVRSVEKDANDVKSYFLRDAPDEVSGGLFPDYTGLKVK